MNETHHLGAVSLTAGEWNDAKVAFQPGATIEVRFRDGTTAVFKTYDNDRPAETISGVIPKRSRVTHWRYLRT
jgi:hypothetical protein